MIYFDADLQNCACSLQATDVEDLVFSAEDYVTVFVGFETLHQDLSFATDFQLTDSAG
jgi:hypothetical protein